MIPQISSALSSRGWTILSRIRSSDFPGLVWVMFVSVYLIEVDFWSKAAVWASVCVCWKLGSALLTADRWKYSLSYRFLRREQPYHISGMFAAAGRMKRYKRLRHLQSYQSAQAQIFSVNPSAASFQSHLSHFPIKQSETPHPVLGDERRLLWLGLEEGGGVVMSSLPLGGISLIKIKQDAPERMEWQSSAGGRRQRGRWRADEVLASEDLKRRSSVFSFPPFFTFTSFLSSSSPPLTQVCSPIIAPVENRPICQWCFTRSARRPSDGLPSTGAGPQR